MLTRDTSYKRGQEELRKAAVDVCIIIAGFVLCYLPIWITSLCSGFLKTQKLPAVVIQITGCLFFLSSLCNSIIYSIEKEAFEQVSRMCLGGLKFVELLTTSSRFQFVVEFRKGNLICTNNWKIWQSNHGSRLWRTTSARATQRYNGRFYRSMLTEHKINRLLFFPNWSDWRHFQKLR